MDEVLLIEATERYANGEMHGDELMHFENYRKQNADIDQFVVNHLAFLRQLDTSAERKHLLATIDTVRAELITNHEINIEEKPEAKIISLKDRFRKKIAIAASVAAILSVCTLGLIFAYNKTKSDKGYLVVSDQNKQMQQDIIKIKDEVNSLKETTNRPFIKANTNGTGFLVGAQGFLVTNYHVVKDAGELYAYNKEFGDLKAKIAAIDPANDLAIIQITDSSFKLNTPIPYTLKNETVALGQKIFTMGYCRPPDITYNEGHISSKASAIELAKTNNFLLTLQVDGGNSGSPIFNSNGQIIGIVSAKETQENGFTLGIKTVGLQPVFKLLKDQKIANISLNNNTLSGSSIDRQTTKIEPFVFMIKVKK